MDFDLTNLTITQVATLAVVLAVIDTLTAMILALTHGAFNLGYVGVWISSHVVKRVFPIFALGILGNGVPAIDLPAIPVLFGLAIAALAAYLGETVASIIGSFAVSTVPTDESPVAPL